MSLYICHYIYIVSQDLASSLRSVVRSPIHYALANGTNKDPNAAVSEPIGSDCQCRTGQGVSSRKEYLWTFSSITGANC